MTDENFTRRELEARFEALRIEILGRFEAMKAEILAQKENVSVAMIAADRAISKAEAAVEKRFENSNEWRNTVETLQRTYMPRTEFDQAVRTLTEKLEAQAKLVYVGVGLLMAVQFFIGIAMVLWKRP